MILWMKWDRIYGIFIFFIVFNIISSLRDINFMDLSDVLYNENMKELIVFDLCYRIVKKRVV